MQKDVSRSKAPQSTANPPEFLTDSVRRLSERLRRGEVSCVEVCRAFIDRVETVNPMLNAVVAPRFEQALDEARAHDRQRAQSSADELPPLFGVPCTIKDFLAVRGMPQTGGLVARKGAIAGRDAVVVERLRQQGAIVLGLTNVPEGGLWLETDNKLYGRTNNPWDLSRTPGGSSGGEGAIVAAGGVPFGIGSDIGGSIRIPAAFCGTVGHKPSGGMVPNTGQFPGVSGRLSSYLCQGPLTRSVDDAALLLSIIRGQDEGDKASRDFAVSDPNSVDLSKLKVFPIEDPGKGRVSPEMRQAVRDATEALAARGAQVEIVKLPALMRGLELWSALMLEAAEAEGQGDYAVLLADGSGKARIRPAYELARSVFGRSPHTVPALLLCLLTGVTGRFGSYQRKLLAEAAALRAELDTLLAGDAVLLYPPYTRTAPRHREPLLTPFDVAHTAIFNPLELPATVVPTGMSASGLPLAVQIIAGRGQDHIALGAARAVEEACGVARIAPLGHPLGRGPR